MRPFKIDVFYSLEDGGYIADARIGDDFISAFGVTVELAVAEWLTVFKGYMEDEQLKKPLQRQSFKAYSRLLRC